MLVLKKFEDGNFYVAVNNFSGEEISREISFSTFNEKVEAWLKAELPKIFAFAGDACECHHLLGILYAENNSSCGGGCGQYTHTTEWDATEVRGILKNVPQNMRNAEIFKFCPECGSGLKSKNDDMLCRHCGSRMVSAGNLDHTGYRCTNSMCNHEEW